MFKRFSILITVIILVLSGISMVSAQTAYVSDELKITLRTGPSTGNKIINMLSSGTPVEVVRSEGDWSYVQISEKGEIKEGWVLNRYLTTELPCEQRAAALLRERNRLQDKVSPLEKNLMEKTTQEQDLAAKLKETSAALGKAESRYKTLTREYADFLALKKEYETSKSDLQNTKQELESLTEKYSAVKSSEGKKWFATGAGVLLCGLLLGLLFGSREKRRKPTYY